MKKTLITLLLAMVAVVQVVAAVGDRFSSGYLTYTVLTEPTSSSYGTVSVYGLSSSGQSASNLSLTIPTQVANGSSTYDVTTIRPIAFDGATNLIAVTVRYGVKSISQQAFQNCSNILLVRLPSSLTFLGKNAFYGCNALGQIYFAAPTPASLTLANGGPFPANSNNIDVYVGVGDANGLPLWQKKLEEYSFKSVKKYAQACDMEWTSAGTYRGLCMTVTQAPTYSSNGKCRVVGFVNNGGTMTVPPCTYLGVNNNYRVDFTEIADSALMNNTLIASVDLTPAQSLTYIGMSAFEGSYITSAKVQYITAGNRAFYNCPKLKTLTFIPRSDAVRYAIGSSVFTGNPELTTVNIESYSVNSLSYRAFYNCPKLSSVTLGEGIQQMAGSVFHGCTSLTSLTIPASVTSLTTSGQMGTFYGCTNLSNISVNSNNTKYSSYAGVLYDKAQTTLLCVPEGYTDLQGFPYTLTTIGNYAFVQCKKITEQEIPYGVKTVGSYVFMNCTAMTRLHIPSSVTSLGEGLCYNCTALNTVSVNMATAPTITPGTFFYGKSQIARLYTPVGAEEEYGFKGWNIFGTVNDDNHFAYDFMNGSSGTNLCYTVTANNSASKTVKTVRGYIPESTISTERDKYIGYKATEQTINIPQQVSYRGNTYTLNTIGNSTFTAEGTAAPTGVLTVNLPSTVTILNAWSFYRSRVKKLSMPGVEIIDAEAFREGTLASVEFPHTLRKVYDGAFKDCSTLTGDAIFPYGFEQIGANVFSGTQISKVVIPSSVTMLNNNALNGMSKWVTAYINLPANSVSSSLSLPSSTLAHLYVPYNEELGYKDKFPDLSGKIYTGGYDFAEKTRNGGYLHYSVTDNTAHTWNGTQFAGKAMIVFNPDASAAPTTLSVTADAHDNALGGSNIYRVTRYDGYCLARCPSQQMNDQGAWESIEEIGAHAFDNSKFAYNIDWPDHRSDLFRVGPQVTKIEFAPFKECNMAGMFLEPASGQRSFSGAFAGSGGDFVCYASYDDKYMNGLAPTNPDILSIYYQKSGVTSDAIYSPVPIDYAATAADYEGFNAFAVTGHDGDVAQAVQIESAPAGTAVMIKKNADNKPIYFKRLAQDPDWTGQTNLLWGNLNYTALHSNDYYYNPSSGLWFNANNRTTELGRGYLKRTDSETPATMTVNYIIYEPYDLNRDGKVDPDDVSYLQQYLNTDMASCDLTGDGEVSLADLNMLISYLVENNPMQLDFAPYFKACDVDEDGFITEMDSYLLSNSILSNSDYSQPFDVNGDNLIDWWDYVIVRMAVNAGVEITSYGVQVFKTTVTTLNYDDVLRDGTVSYEPATHTLTLNNANITPVGESNNGSIVDTDNYVTYGNTAVIQVSDRAIFGNYQTLNVRLIGENNIAVRDWVANNSQRIVTAFHIKHNDVNIMGDGSLDISTHYGAQLATGAELKITDGAKVNFASYTAGIGIIGPNTYQSWPATTATLTVDNAWLKVVGGTATHPIQRIAKIELIDAEYITPANAYYFDYDGTILDGDTGEYATTVEIAPTSTGIVGDVDGNGTVDVADVNILVNIMLGKANAADYPNANVDGQDGIDVGDVNMIVNIMLGKQ